MANMYYNFGKVGQLDGTFQWGTTIMKCALMSSNYVPAASHSLYTQISTSETVGTGYTAGGSTLGTVSVTSQATSAAFVDVPDVAWASSSINAAWAVIYASTSGRLVGAYDFGGSNTTSNGTFSISWHSSDGILKIA